jgi:hypothetical protein
VHVRAILFDPCGYLINSADGPVTRDEDIDVARHALEQPQRGEVVIDRVSGVVRSGIGIKTSESMSPATRTPRSSINSAAWPRA